MYIYRGTDSSSASNDSLSTILTHTRTLDLIKLASKLASKHQFTMVASPNPDATSITIFGATGIQGGSVLRHLLQSDRPYRIRAVTRDPTKDSAKKLSKLGVEVVKAELGDEGEVKRAVEGQDLVFVSVTAS
jgi:hypothetical protein